MSSSKSIVAVLCDQQCGSSSPLEAARLSSRLPRDSVIEKLIVLEKACQDPEKKLSKIKGKKILFAGCPYLDEIGFYDKAVKKLGLASGEYLCTDVKSAVVDLYENAVVVEDNLLRKLEGLGRLLGDSVPVTESPLKLKRNVLVFGSGLCGLQTALEMTGEELSVDLIETDDFPLAPGCLSELLRDPGTIETLKEKAQNSEHITFFPYESLSGVQAVETGFSIRFPDGRQREYGAVVFAPERTEKRAEEAGAWNLTQLYEKLSAGQPIKGRVVILLDRRFQTPAEILQDVLMAARVIKQRSHAEVWILLKQVRVDLPGLQELYDSCRDMGIIFVKYENLNLENDYGDFEISGRDPQSGANFRINRPDRLIIPGAIGLSQAARQMAGRLGIELLGTVYSQPYSLWLLANQSNRPGVLVAGSARGNLDAIGVADEAAAVIMGLAERFAPEGLIPIQHIASVDTDACVYCLTCLRVCPHGAVAKNAVKRAANVLATFCRGCGICASECPAEAISLRNLAKQSIQAGMQALI